MVMSSYEVVRRAITFEGPDRLPVSIPDLGLDDLHGVGWNQIGVGDRAFRRTLDEWGCLWERSEVANMGQVKGHPLADWAALDRFRWPNPDDPGLYAGMEERFAGSEGKFITTGIFMLLFERLHALRGFENTLADLYLERERIEMLADRIVEYDLAIMENIGRRFPGRIHGFSFSDDWGTEQALFINPALWDEFFKPRYRRLFAAAKDQGWYVMMHSCGHVNAIIDSLIDIGLDVINLQQPRTLGIEEIGRRFRGRICFLSLCDIQHTLPFCGREEIAAEATLLLQHWATPQGGFILGDYGDPAAIGVSLEKKRWMLEAFQAADPWRKAVAHHGA
ncbi:MAG: uroporphyrinogen decarboxylase family protein [Anaerolineae bacterium]